MKLCQRSLSVKVGFAFVLVLVAAGVVFMVWRSYQKNNYDLPIVHITHGTTITLSLQEPESRNASVAPRRLVSIDYENRRACIEVYHKKRGWQKYWVNEDEYTTAGTLLEIDPNKIKILVTWPGSKYGREAMDLIEQLKDKYHIAEDANTTTDFEPR